MAYTHLEIDPMTLLGVVAGLIPNPHHNQSPRLLQVRAALRQELVPVLPERGGDRGHTHSVRVQAAVPGAAGHEREFSGAASPFPASFLSTRAIGSVQVLPRLRLK